VLACAIVALVGCESAEEKCRAAQNAANGAWGSYVDSAIVEARSASEARDRALDAAAGQLMDLGNLRTEGSQGLTGARHEGFVGIEVSIGALLGAALAAAEVWPTDAEAGALLAAAVTEELDGRYAELMTAPMETDEQARRLAEVGDACATRLQLLVREQPERTRARVLVAFESLRAREGEPAAGTTLESAKSAWAEFVQAASTAQASQARLDAAVAAREATGAPSADARTAADAVPTGESPELAGARETSAASFVACAEAGM
jgi:hypothetical protein